MKKRVFCLVGILWVFLFFAATVSFAEWKPERKFLKIATAGRAGVWALIGARLAEAIQKEIPGLTVSVTGGGGRINPTAVDHLIVLKDSNIKTVADLSNKRINACPVGFGSEVFIKNLLAFYNLSYEKIKANGGSVSHLQYVDGTEMMKDGHLVCNADLSDELVYRITKILWKGVPEWRKTVASLRETNVKGALLGNQIDLHAGAKKYYREIGIVK